LLKEHLSDLKAVSPGFAVPTASPVIGPPKKNKFENREPAKRKEIAR